MRFYRVDSAQGGMAQSPWTTGAFGIREPADCSAGRLFRGEDGPALVVTPGLAFDKEGRRVGRGGGYYDKFLAFMDGKGASYYTIGFCLASQVIEEVPVDSHDKRLNALCTGEGFWSFS
jgi:5-formyltetrahydrofolate cyclo-ligase